MAWPEDSSNPRTANPRPNKDSTWVVFFILFLLTGGMLVYYQFYQGNGKWHFTLMHKSNDTTFLSQLKTNLPQKTGKSDSSLNVTTDTPAMSKDSMHKISTTVQPTDNAGNDNTKSLKPVYVDEKPPTGTVYEVQIGTIENYDLKKYHAIFNNLHEEKDGKLTKLTLGRFETQAQANSFKKRYAQARTQGCLGSEKSEWREGGLVTP